MELYVFNADLGYYQEETKVLAHWLLGTFLWKGDMWLFIHALT